LTPSTSVDTAADIAGESGYHAAILAAPRWDTLTNRNRRYGQVSQLVEPPEPEERAAEQAHENGGGQISSEQVLCLLAGGRAGTQPGTQSLLGDPQMPASGRGC